MPNVELPTCTESEDRGGIAGDLGTQGVEYCGEKESSGLI